MKLSTYMAAVASTVSEDGERTGRQMVLALDCTEDGDATEANYAVVANHIENHGASLNAKTADKSYIGEGDSTLKMSTQRTFDVTGQLLRGDEFHDFINSFAIKFGVGSAVQRSYVYFDPGTGEGEKGVMTIIVNKDGAAAASDPADIDVRLAACGIPTEYTYTAASGNG
ncbi:MAG: hypothetical protein II062_04000 [Oscillospiraceae bacterium]|nr:hypothetical protein [Oscillospiraceae bacterium]